jgi:hypothetical protein
VSPVKEGHRRVFVVAGVGGFAGGRWADVPADHRMLEGWLRAGLVQERGPKGEEAPERITRACCGSLA